MDNWERFNETALSDKKAFCSNLIIEDITDVDYKDANSVFKEFKMNSLGDYHNWYVKSDQCCLLMYLRILEKCVLKYMN